MHSLRKPEFEAAESCERHQILFESIGQNVNFDGICMDDGAQKSVAGLEAYERYCAYTNTPIDLIPSTKIFKLGTGIHKSLRTTIIRFPIDAFGNFLEYETDVINVDAPIFFGLDKMKQHKWFVNEVTDEFCSYNQPEMKVKLKFKLGLLYLEWPPAVVLFSRSELIKIHRRFAHSTADKLCALLKKAAPQQFDQNTRKISEDIARHCQSCQRMAPKPFLSQVTMPDDIQFNHEVIVDISWIEKRPHRPVLHIVDRVTHF